jgi:predicted PurR-regulated permease PerM
MPKHIHLTTRRWFFIVVSILVLFLFWKIVSPFIITIITAAIFAIVLTPVANRLEKHIHHRKIASLLMIIGTFVIILIPVTIIVIVMAQQASEIITLSLAQDSWLRTFDISTNALFLALPEFIQAHVLQIDLVQIGTSTAEWAFSNIGSLFTNIAAQIFRLGIFFIALYFILVERDIVYKEILSLSPLKDTLDASIVHRIVKTVRGVVFGALVVAFLQATIAAIGMTIFGVPGAILWGALVIIAAQIPLVGAALIMGPAVIYLAVTGDMASAVGLLAWAIIFVGLIDNIISPHLIGGRTQLNSFLILISILGGLQLFGPIGLILGPTTLAALMVVLELYKSGILEKR